MDINDLIFKEIIKSGRSESKSSRVWYLANRDLLYMTPKLARGFLDLNKVERYNKTVVSEELALLESNAAEIKSKIKDGAFNLIDVGCSDGLKARQFLKIMGKANVRFCPVSTSNILLDLTVKNVKKSKISSVKEYKPQQASFYEMDTVLNMLRNSKYQRNVILLMGSMLGSFEINDYLFHLSRNMFKGDYLIIGNGIRKGERYQNLDTYKHKVFDNWFVNLMNEMGFKNQEVKYDARFANSRIEIFYKIQEDKKITHKNQTINFRKGDEIVVAYLYKYYAAELEKLSKQYFSEVSLFKDKDDEYALLLCKK